MPYYAQIDPDGFCKAVTQTSGEISSSNMIPIGGLDESLLGKMYQNGQFIEPSKDEPVA